MYVIHGILLLAAAVLVAIAIVRPLHRLLLREYRPPTLWETVETVGSHLLFSYVPALLISLMLSLAFGKELLQVAHQIAPELSKSLGSFILFFALVAIVWTVVVSVFSLLSLKRTTHPDYDSLKLWVESMERMTAGMAEDRARRALKRPVGKFKDRKPKIHKR